MALVNVTVTDPYNRLVTGLEPDNFRVFEDNAEQEVVTFSSEDVPISIGVIFDLSRQVPSALKVMPYGLVIRIYICQLSQHPYQFLHR